MPGMGSKLTLVRLEGGSLIQPDIVRSGLLAAVQNVGSRREEAAEHGTTAQRAIRGTTITEGLERQVCVGNGR